MLYDFVVDSLYQPEVLDRQPLRPVRRTLANQSDTLLAFATRLGQELGALAKPFAVVGQSYCGIFSKRVVCSPQN